MNPRPIIKTIARAKTQVFVVGHTNQMQISPVVTYLRPKQIIASPRRKIESNLGSPQVLKKCIKLDFQESLETIGDYDQVEKILKRFNSIVDTSLQEKRLEQAIEYNKQKIEQDRIQKSQEDYLKQLTEDNK